MNSKFVTSNSYNSKKTSESQKTDIVEMPVTANQEYLLNKQKSNYGSGALWGQDQVALAVEKDAVKQVSGVSKSSIQSTPYGTW